MAVAEDVKVLISCGRPAVVCAVTDLRRLVAAAMEEARGPEQAAARVGNSTLMAEALQSFSTQAAA